VAVVAVAVAVLVIGVAVRILGGGSLPLSWSRVSSPGLPFHDGGSLQAVTCVSATNCWAVGDVAVPDAFSQPLIEQNTGNGWHTVANDAGGNGQLNDVTCVSATDCWAVGYSFDAAGDQLTLAEQDEGGGWRVVPSADPSGGVDDSLDGVTCVSVTDCWAVGGYADASTINDSTLIEQDTGSGWHIVSASILPSVGGLPGVGQLSSVTCIDANDCWAVGYSSQTLIEHFTGSRWSIVSAPSPGGNQVKGLFGVTCLSASDCWAVGGYMRSNFATPTLVERYTGSGWSIVASPSPGYARPGLNAVSCPGGDDCWAVGGYVSSTGPHRSLIEQYTGGGWTVVSNPTPSGGTDMTLNGVDCVSESDCWAVGQYNEQAGNGQPLIEQGT
jgi:hypothetical protein